MSAESRALPAELRAFLYSCIESIEQVELVMMLRGSERWRTAREVASEFSLSPAAARQSLETFAARGLLDVRVGDEISYRFRPKSEELGRYCDLLAQHYISSRAEVLGFVSANSRLSAKRFADAFKLRGTE